MAPIPGEDGREKETESRKDLNRGQERHAKQKFSYRKSRKYSFSSSQDGSTRSVL